MMQEFWKAGALARVLTVITILLKKNLRQA